MNVVAFIVGAYWGVQLTHTFFVWWDQRRFARKWAAMQAHWAERRAELDQIIRDKYDGRPL